MKRHHKLVWSAAVAAAAVALIPASASSAGVSSSVALTSLESSVVVQLNRVRVEHGLVPLQVSDDLAQAANWHDAQMATKGYFAHDDATEPFVKRLERFYPVAGYGFWSVAENLLWAQWTPDGSRVVASWMASPEHRANILDPHWRQIGVSAVSAANAPGIFGGHTVTIVTADFGIRKPV